MKTTAHKADKTTTKGRGAPQGNTNSVRHGLMSSKLPKQLLWVERRTLGFRKVVEAAVIAAKNEVNLLDAATINTAIRWERHAILAAYWLNKQLDELNPDQRLKYSEAVAKASDARDKCLRQLGLNTQPELPSLQDYIEGKLIGEAK